MMVKVIRRTLNNVFANRKKYTMTKDIQLTTEKPKKDPLEAEFTKKKQKKAEDEFKPVNYFSLYRYATKWDKFMLSIGVLSTVGTGAIQPLNMLVFGTLTGNMIENVQQGDFSTFSDTIYEYMQNNCILGALMLVLSYISTYMFNYCSVRQSLKIRNLYLEKALNQDISWYDVHQSGDFASRMGDDLIKVEDGIGEKVALFLHFQLSFVGCLLMALINGWELALICLISLPVTMISIGIVAYLTSKLAKNEMDAYGTAGVIAEEVFSTIRTVLAFGGQQKEKDRYERQLVFARDNNIRRALLSGIGFCILWFSIYASYALAFWYGVGLIIEDKESTDPTYTPANMVTVFFSIMTGSMNFGISSPYIEVFGVARGAAAKVFGVIDNIPKINISKNNGVKLDKIEGNISFDNVYFNYPSRPEVKILQGLSLKINPGETIALVGPSGCGKSTCIQLLQRFYDPEQGTVTVDGTNLQDMDLTWFRNNVGVVGQEPVLFGTTIEENIRNGFPGASMQDIEMAARKANAHKFIKTLPDGYNTLVGERGAQLSGGQKQRIAIARALVRKPKILLLDEATSALDTKSEAIVQAALDQASLECTTIIVAHRLSTIRGANRIVVIKDGVVVEQGTHKELMELKHHYYSLVTTQLGAAGDVENDQGNHLQQLEDEDDKFLRMNSVQLNRDEVVEVAEEDVSLMKILALNKPEWPFILVGVVSSAGMGCAMPIFAVLFGDIIGLLSGTDNDYIRSETNKYCIFFVLAGVLAGAATFFQMYMFGNAGEKLVMRVRSDMFETMMRQEIGWFDRRENGVGALCAKLSSEAASIQGATGQRIGTIFQSIATLALSVGLSMFYEWKLGLVAMVFAPLILAAIYFQQKMLMDEAASYRKALETSTKIAMEAVTNIRTVASLGVERSFQEKYNEQLLPYIAKSKRNMHFRSAILSLARSIMFFAFAACIYYGGQLVLNEGLEFQNVLKVSQSLIMGTVSIANALAFTPNFQKGIDAARTVFKLLGRQPKIQDTPNPSTKEWKTGNIQYSDIEFYYPTRQDTRVLKGLNLKVAHGKTIALVGPSGCGKSTIIQLIERFYDPTEGTVYAEDQDIKNLKLATLRAKLGIVSQEPNLFDRTIKENIAYGDNSQLVPDDVIIEAAKKANIHNFIVNLPLGYDTPLGDKGTQLSGGQKQRIAIARALVRNPQVLLLDEATSALDTESEKMVQDALDQAKEGRTCITIAHRLSTIQDADVIYVINEGVVHEAGTHSELISKKGLYYHLYSLQSGSR